MKTTHSTKVNGLVQVKKDVEFISGLMGQDTTDFGKITKTMDTAGLSVLTETYMKATGIMICNMDMAR